ncbi:hypothetical protein [Limisalsivibrio acetivorans]|uniref:hypothetical protein n=1 Tax=Limisalsivibrio acetivorans TaxID=1304888 RepID=UPI0003B5940D|nr:hypothetical protein [Limisalsivibrio acetivorans]
MEMERILSLIPAPDAVPLPSHTMVFIFFYVFTFFLHILFVNLTLGGSILLVLARFFGRNVGNENYTKIAGEIGWVNTFNISLTITTGVAPLLFLQVIYGQFFYSSSIILGWKWLFVLAYIILGYYGYYVYKFKPGYLKHRVDGGGFFITAAAVLFMLTAFMLVTNTLLSLQPEKWAAIYTGERSAFSLDTIIPRYLHFTFASIAVTGLFLMIYSELRKKYTPEFKKEMKDFGAKAFVWSTFMQIPIGIWFLLSHDRDLLMLLMGRSMIGTAFLFIGIVTGLAAAIIVWKNKKADTTHVTALMLVAIISMLLVRRTVEHGYFSRYFDYNGLIVDAQWGSFGMFIAFLVLMLVVLFVMFQKLYLEFKGTKSPKPAKGSDK